MVTDSEGSGWSVQLEYSDFSINGPWSVFPSGIVNSTNSVPVGGGYGYHQWVRLNTTSGGTTVTLSCVKDFFLPASGSGGGGGSGTVTLITGSATINIGVIPDGVLTNVTATISVPGAAIGDTVQVYTSLSSGIEIFGDVTSANTVTVRLLNLRGVPFTPGSIVIGAAVLHSTAGGSGAVSKLSGVAAFASNAITDGALPVLSTTITVSGAAIGDPVSVSASTSLPQGILVFGDVTSANIVTIRMMNLTGATYSPGSNTFTSTVLHYTSGGTGGATGLLGSATFSPGSIADGSAPILGTSISVNGAAVGDPVTVTTDASLPSGIRVFGNVTSTNSVTLRLLDLSGATYSPGTTVFNIVVWH